MRRIRVVLVDDTSMFLEGLSLLIGLQPDMEVVGTAADGAAGLQVVRAQQPDLVLMDMRMPVMDGVEATRRIRAELPSAQVLILTTYSDDAYIVEGLKAGAAGYLLKDMPSKELIQAMRSVCQGGVLILPAVAARLLSGVAPQGAPAGELTRMDELTPREREILRLIVQGMSNKEIAAQIFLSEGTIKNYVSAIYSKLHARDRAQAVSFAMRQGLTD